jgi:hypothetical protein
MYTCVLDQSVAIWHIYKQSKTGKYPGKHANGMYGFLDARYNYLVCGLLFLGGENSALPNLWQISEQSLLLEISEL